MKPLRLLTAWCALVAGPFALGTLSTVTPPAGYVPCRVVKHERAVFPQRLLERGILHGDVVVVLEVDTTGQVRDRLVTRYTHREFAREAERAIDRWGFAPGTVDGEPVVSILTVNFEFTVEGVAVYERRFDGEDAQRRWYGEFEYAPHGPATLDRRPVALAKDSPPYPEEWRQQGLSGLVRVRFYIDETGRTRLPIVVTESDQRLASAALAAVREWRFEPPIADGKPVLAHAEQAFVFEGNGRE